MSDYKVTVHVKEEVCLGPALLFLSGKWICVTWSNARVCLIILMVSNVFMIGFTCQEICFRFGSVKVDCLCGLLSRKFKRRFFSFV